MHVSYGRRIPALVLTGLIYVITYGIIIPVMNAIAWILRGVTKLSPWK